MKQQATHYLGLDVHRATTVATCRPESGAVVLKATVPTEAKAIVGLVRSQGPRVHVAFEEGRNPGAVGVAVSFRTAKTARCAAERAGQLRGTICFSRVK